MERDFNIVSILDSTADTLLRRMYSASLKRTVLIKTNHIYSSENKAKLSYEFEMLEKLEDHWLLKPVKMEIVDKQEVIIYEDFNGVTLESLLKQRLSISSFLTIAIELANAFMSLHQKNILLNSLYPSNILIHELSFRVKLVSTEYLSKLDAVSSSIIENPYDKIKHLAYLAPEQTGRLHWGIDQRSDLYALGVVFYEMLCGEKPFDKSDPVELIYEIITKIPIPLHLKIKDLPEMISVVIEKLLSKNPEMRYQSAIGLKEDLVSIQKILQDEMQLETFLPGKYDVQMHIGLVNKLFGRGKPLEILQSLFNNVEKDAKKIVFVTGNAGVGKSSFVEELKQCIFTSKGYFVKSKFDQLQDETPFTPIFLPLRKILKQIYLEGEKSVSLWRKLFKDVDLQVTEQLFILIPELSWFVESTLEVVSNNSDNTRQLHAYIFTSIQKILSTFAIQKRPVVLFMDDLQWADRLSVEMLNQIYEQHKFGYLLIIAAYRQKEISASHPIIAWQQQLSEFDTIPLKLLSEGDIIEWVEESFNNNFPNIQSFGRQLYYVTGGNPLFVKELFLSFQKDKVIYYDMLEKQWKFNPTHMDQIVSSEELLILIEKRIDYLDVELQQVLLLASCFGKQFEFGILSNLTGYSFSRLLYAIEELIVKGFIVALDPHYKWASAYEQKGILNTYILQFQFVHDRIQQVAYMRLTEEERTNCHLKVTNILKDESVLFTDTNKLLEIVKHANYCRHLLSTKEKQALAVWNYELGIHIKKSGLYENALFFFTNSLELLPESHWENMHDLALNIYEQLGECEYLVGQYDLSEMYLNMALENSKNKLEKLSIYKLKTLLYIESDRTTAGLACGLEGLKIGNMEMVKNPSNLSLLKEFALLKIALKNKSNIIIQKMPVTKNKEIQFLIEIINNMTASSYRINPKLTGILMLRAMRLILKYGGMDESGIVFSNFALLLKGGFDDIAGAYRYGRLAIDLAEKQNNIYLKARIYFVYGTFINHCKEKYEENIYYLEKAQQYSNNIGLYHIVSVSACFICTAKLINGDSLEVLAQYMEKQRTLFSTNTHTLSNDFLHEFNLWINILQNAEHDIVWNYPYTIEEDDSILIMHLNLRLKMSFLLQDEQQALEILGKLQKPMKNAFSLLITPYYFYYRALWQMNWIRQDLCTRAEKTEYFRDIKESIKKLAKWSKHAQQNYKHLYTLLQAEYNYMKRKNQVAVLYYDHAIQLAHVHGFAHDEAIACERAANYYMAEKNYKIAENYIIHGIELMDQWGAKRVSRKWEEKYEVVITSFVPKKKIQAISFDMLNVVKMTKSLSQEIQMEDLLRKMLFSILEHANANIGYFLQKEDNGFGVLAKAEVDNFNFTFYKNKPLEGLPKKLQSIVRYTKQTGEFVIIDHAQLDKKFVEGTEDEKSIFCLPIQHKGKIVGILYLENNVTYHAFSEEKVELLRVMSAQIAVSIENAQLYEDLEQRVEERTKQLAKSNAYLIEANDLLQKNEIERKRLLHGISHELRSPITSTLGYIESILDGVVSNEEQKVLYLHRSKERLLSLNRLIQDLFDLAHLEAGRMEYDYTLISAQELYHGLTVKHGQEIIQKGLEYSTEFGLNEDVMIMIDVGRVEQVFTNLIQNAIKYTEQGKIDFSMKVQDDRLIFKITDSGVGISKNEMAFIFDSYFKASNNKNKETHGIGLSISKQIIIQHGGEIFIESEEGEGASLTFTLPIFKND